MTDRLSEPRLDARPVYVAFDAEGGVVRGPAPAPRKSRGARTPVTGPPWVRSSLGVRGRAAP